MGIVMSVALLLTAVTSWSVSASGTTASTTKSHDAIASASAKAMTNYVSAVPTRVLDTRVGVGAPAAMVGAGHTVVLSVLGVGGVPVTGVDAVVLNVIAVAPTQGTFITVWPSGSTRPLASNVNADAGATVSNLAIAKLGVDGTVSLFNLAGDVDLVADVQGWFPSGTSYTPLVPSRVLDTRSGLGGAQARVGGQGTIDVAVTGIGGVPAAGVGAVVLNVTAVQPSMDTFVTAWPTGVDRPLASNLNAVAGATVANVVIAKIGADGKVSLFNNSGDIDLVVDVEGWMSTGEGYSPLLPARLLDTRVGLGSPLAQVGAGQSIDVVVTGVGGVPASGVGAVVLNVTAVKPGRDTFVTMWPTGTNRPFTSNLNVRAGEIVPNEVIAPVGANGKVSFYNNTGHTDLVIDVQGWFSGAGSSEEPVPPTTTPPTTPPTTTPPTDSIDLGSTALAAGWQFLPRSTTLTHAGDSKIVHLVLADANGDQTDTAVPPTITLVTVGDTGVMSIEQQPDGSIKVTALTDSVGTVVLAARIPGQVVGPSTSLTVAHFRPGVVQLTDADVLFPRATGPDGVSPWTQGLVGPFTTAELRARTKIPNEADRTDPTIFTDPDIHYPMVVIGAPPATGAIVAAVESFTGFGRVIEADGLPTIQRDGYSLISIASVPFKDAFLDLHIDLNSDQMRSIGAAAGSHVVTYDCTAADKSTCPQATDATESDSPDLPQPDPLDIAAPGPPRATHSSASASAASPPSASPEAAPRNIASDACAPTITAGVADIKVSSYQIVVSPVFGFGVTIGDGDSLGMYLRSGFVANGSAGMSVKLQGTVEAQLECKLAGQGEETTTQLGWASAFISAFSEQNLLAKANITLKAGPSVSYAPTCSFYKRVVFSFTVLLDGTVTTTSDNPNTESHCDTIGDPSPTVFLHDGDPGVPLSLEFKVGIFGQLKVGIRLGGVAARTLGEIFQTPDFGKLSLLSVDAGPQLRLSWENRANTLANNRANSFYGVELKVSLNSDLMVDPFTKLTKCLLGGAGHTISIPLAEFGLPLGGKYMPINPPSPGDPELIVSVNGVSKTTNGKDEVLVHPGDTVSVSATVYQDTALVRPAEAAVTASTAWTKTGLTQIHFLENLTGPGDPLGIKQVVSGSDVVKPSLCSALAAGAHLLLLGDTLLEQIVPTPAYLGDINLKCDPSMAFSPTSIAFVTAGNDIHHPHPATLGGSDIAGYHWALDPLPTWLTADLSSGSFGGTNNIVESSTINFSLNCLGFEGQQLSGTVSAHTTDSHFPTELAAELTVTADCRQGFVHLDPEIIGGSGGALAVTTDGPVAQPWSFGALPDWASISPDSGTFDALASTVALSVEIDLPEPVCSLRPGKVAIVAIQAGDRGTATLRLEQPAPPVKSNCDRARALGDPHFLSFDGNYFDAMIVGEYIYFAPNGSAELTDGPRLQVRHEQTHTGTGMPATSVIAIAYSEQGHHVEVYSRPAFKVVVDGIDQTALGSGTFQLAPGLTAAFRDSTVTIDGPTAHLTAVVSGIIDLYVGVTDPSLRGMLGNADDNKLDDLTLSTGGTITLAQAQLHEEAMYSFTNSWRVTDTNGTSMFPAGSDPNDTFHQRNPPFSSADLAPFRAGAVAVLDRVSRLCSGAGNAALVDSVAMEIAVGTPQIDLGQFSCEYILRGTVRSGSSPVSSVNVTITAPGLKPCTTTTGPSGDYYCELTPDLAAIALLPAAQALTPVTATVTAAFADGSVFTTNHPTFTTTAPLNESSYLQSDIDVPAGLLATANVSGTITIFGVAPTTPVYMLVVAYNGPRSWDTLGQTYRQLSFDGTGTYSLQYLLPKGTTRVTLTSFPSDLGTEQFNQAATVTDTGPQPITFSYDYTPPRVTVHGHLTENGAASTEGGAINLESYDVNNVYTGTVWVPLTVDTFGNYSFVQALPLNAVHVTATMRVGSLYSQDTFTKQFDVAHGSPPGNDQTFDASYSRTTLHFSGAIHVDGAVPAVSPTLLVTVPLPGASYFALGPRLDLDPTTGVYNVDVVLPIFATGVAYHTVIPGTADDEVDVVLSTLTPGTQAVLYSLDVHKTIFNLAGVLSYHGQPLRSTPAFVYTAEVDLIGLDSSGAQVSGPAAIYVRLDGNGAYAVTAVEPAGVVTMRASAHVYYPGYTVVQDFPLDLHTTTNAVLDGDMTRVDFRGIVSYEGTPLTDQLDLPVTFTAYDAADNVLATIDEGLVTVQNGVYSVSDQVPTSWDHVTASFGSGTSHQATAVVDPLNDVIVDFSFDIGNGSIKVSGTATHDGAPYSGDATMTLTPYQLDFANARSATPYTAMESITQDITVVDGQYVAAPILVTGATFVQVEIVLNDNATGYVWSGSNSYQLDLGSGSITFDVNANSALGQPSINIFGSTVLGGACASNLFAFTYQIWSLPDLGAGANYDASTGTYPLGTLVKSGIVIPDPVTGRYFISAAFLHGAGVQGAGLVEHVLDGYGDAGAGFDNYVIASAFGGVTDSHSVGYNHDVTHICS